MGSAADIVQQIAKGTRSAAAVLAECKTLIARKDPELNCFTAKTFERAEREAAAIDALYAQGKTLPPLAGVPYAVKNLFDVEGMVTLAGAKLNAGNAPAAADATIVARMSRAGAVLVGALNMEELAYGFLTENHHYGTTRNPHDLERGAGGSSGGSAAAVGAGMLPITLGSDTSGSIRVPASLCGVFGLKPTYGRLPRTGTFPFGTAARQSTRDHESGNQQVTVFHGTSPRKEFCQKTLGFGPPDPKNNCVDRFSRI